MGNSQKKEVKKFEVQMSREQFNERMTAAKKLAMGYFMNSFINELHGQVEQKQWLSIFDLAKKVESEHRKIYDNECEERTYG